MGKTIKKAQLRAMIAEAINHWYDKQSHKYIITGLVKSDYNPMKREFVATNVTDAIEQAIAYFSRFSQYGEDDIEIISLKNCSYE